MAFQSLLVNRPGNGMTLAESFPVETQRTQLNVSTKLFQSIGTSSNMNGLVKPLFSTEKPLVPEKSAAMLLKSNEGVCEVNSDCSEASSAAATCQLIRR